MSTLQGEPPHHLEAATGDHAHVPNDSVVPNVSNTPDVSDMPEDLAYLIHIDSVTSARLIARVAERLPDELTSTQAAEYLNMSRPTLMKKISDGKISAHKVGTHTRLYTRDVLDYLFRSHRDRLVRFITLAEKDTTHNAGPTPGSTPA